MVESLAEATTGSACWQSWIFSQCERGGITKRRGEGWEMCF